MHRHDICREENQQSTKILDANKRNVFLYQVSPEHIPLVWFTPFLWNQNLAVIHHFGCLLYLKRNVKLVQWNIFQWSEHVWYLYWQSWYGHGSSKMGSLPPWTETRGNTFSIPTCISWQQLQGSIAHVMLWARQLLQESIYPEYPGMCFHILQCSWRSCFFAQPVDAFCTNLPTDWQGKC